MKFLFFCLFWISCTRLFSQQLQLHYDPRHTLDPKHTTKNFTTAYFEYYKKQDSGKGFIKPGSFLLKLQADFMGAHNNMGKFYMQVSQSFRCWKPKIFLSLQYSGGLGITEPKQYSYYISNTYSVGADYPFQLGHTYFSSQLYYKTVAYTRPSHDLLYTLYWWKGLHHYKIEWAGDFSVWTENKNHGDDLTKTQQGKRFFFFAEPQLWYNVNAYFSIGTKFNTYYHVLTSEHRLQVYPTIAMRCKL